MLDPKYLCGLNLGESGDLRNERDYISFDAILFSKWFLLWRANLSRKYLRHIQRLYERYVLFF